MADSNTLCFSCGQSVVEVDRINRMEDGEPCPACADRLLQSMPPLLPGFRHGPAPRQESDPTTAQGIENDPYLTGEGPSPEDYLPPPEITG